MDFNARGSIGADNRENYIKEMGGTFTCTNGKWSWVSPPTSKPAVVKKPVWKKTK